MDCVPSIARTLTALGLASSAAMLMFFALQLLAHDIGDLGGIMARDLAITALTIGVIAFLTALAFVMPVLVFVPRLRRLSVWIAAPWGAATACVPWVTAVVGSGGAWPWVALGYLSVMGAASGVVYALAARRV